jgi:hypothetical protein
MARAAVKMLKYLRRTKLATLFYERKHGAMRKHGAALLLRSTLNPRLSLKHRRAAVKTRLKKSCTTLAVFLPYLLRDGLVIKDGGLKRENCPAHYIEPVDVPGLLIFPEGFLERTCDACHCSTNKTNVYRPCKCQGCQVSKVQ